jgi:hypothetical protein
MRSYARLLGAKQWFVQRVWPIALNVHVQSCLLAGGVEQVYRLLLLHY